MPGEVRTEAIATGTGPDIDIWRENIHEKKTHFLCSGFFFRFFPVFSFFCGSWGNSNCPQKSCVKAHAVAIERYSHAKSIYNPIGGSRYAGRRGIYFFVARKIGHEGRKFPSIERMDAGGHMLQYAVLETRCVICCFSLSSVSKLRECSRSYAPLSLPNFAN